MTPVIECKHTETQASQFLYSQPFLYQKYLRYFFHSGTARTAHKIKVLKWLVQFTVRVHVMQINLYIRQWNSSLFFRPLFTATILTVLFCYTVHSNIFYRTVKLTFPQRRSWTKECCSTVRRRCQCRFDSLQGFVFHSLLLGLFILLVCSVFHWKRWV